ncbi:hypothetical protein C8J56DRAFT_898072 [Mycena floridula]|nr:hypothetical protein C8J56DRAFT_898072 [Mycena floridula]
MPRKIILGMLMEKLGHLGFILAFVPENSLEDCIINDGPIWELKGREQWECDEEADDGFANRLENFIQSLGLRNDSRRELGYKEEGLALISKKPREDLDDLRYEKGSMANGFQNLLRLPVGLDLKTGRSTRIQSRKKAWYRGYSRSRREEIALERKMQSSWFMRGYTSMICMGRSGKDLELCSEVVVKIWNVPEVPEVVAIGTNVGVKMARGIDTQLGMNGQTSRAVQYASAKQCHREAFDNEIFVEAIINCHRSQNNCGEIQEVTESVEDSQVDITIED